METIKKGPFRINRYSIKLYSDMQEGRLGGPGGCQCCVSALELLFTLRLAPQNPVMHFDLPVRLENWFPRQLVRQKREEIRGLIMRMHQSQSEGR